MSSVQLYEPDGIPDDVVRFWRERQQAQDRFMSLTAGPEWYSMMAASRSGAVVAVVRGEQSSASAPSPSLRATADKEVGSLPRVSRGRKSEVGVRRTEDGGQTTDKGQGTTLRSRSGQADDRHLKAVLPLFPITWPLDFNLGGRCWFRRPLPVMRVCGGDLVEDGLTPEELAAAWGILFERQPGVRGVWFDHAQAGRRSGMIRASAGGGFFVHEAFAGLPHYRLRLPPTVEELRSRRSPESIKKIRGRERALGKAAGGECRLIEIRRPADWEPYSEKIGGLMGRTWQSERLGHQFSLSSLADVAARGWLRSFLLLAGERPAAFAFCFQGCGVFVYEQIGYDPDLAKYSPGTILLYGLLERLYASDTPECVDFGEGEAEYKSLLANDVTHSDGLLVVHRGRSQETPFRAAAVLRKAGALLRSWSRSLKT